MISEFESGGDFIRTRNLAPATQDVIPRWYVAQTCAQHEKRVSEQLGQRLIDNFLPLYERVSQWKDRRMRLQVPLFPGYVFVRVALSERLRVLEISSVARLIGFGRIPTAVPDEEIEKIHNSLKSKRAEPHPYLSIGQRVRINRGPLEGVEGILVRRKNCIRLVLSVALIQRSIAVEVDVTDITAIAAVREFAATQK